MAYVSKAINYVKDAAIWQVDMVARHPWIASVLIWALALCVAVF
jgi:uncharacterized membrane protein